MEKTAPFLGGSGHARLADYKKLIDERHKSLGDDVFEGIFKFCFVRNPWDRFVSTFFHPWQDLTGIPNDEKNANTFQEFVEKVHEIGLRPDDMYPEPGHWYVHHHFLPQWYFVEVDGQIAVDFCGRFERLTEDWNKICEMLQWPPIPLPRYNKSEHRPYWEYYDRRTAQMIADLYSKDIDTFKYTFRPRRRKAL